MRLLAKMYDSINPPSMRTKELIQYIHKQVLTGNYDPCPYCSGRGTRTLLDAAGDVDYEDCTVCKGWSVLKVEKK